MPAHTAFRSPTSSDAKIIRSFDNIAKELGQNPSQCSVDVDIMTGYTFPKSWLLSEIGTQPFVEHAKQHQSASWEGVSIYLQELKLRIAVRRDRQQGEDEIKISFQEDPPNPVEVSRSLIAIQKPFRPQNRAAAIEKALGPELSEFYRRREEGLSQLEDLTRNLISDTHDYRVKLDEETAQKRQALTASFDEKRRLLDTEHDRRLVDLATREQDLENMRRDLDDRSARHARREQSRALQKKISERSQEFTLTPTTQHKRLPIHLIFCLLLSLSGGLILRSLLSETLPTGGVALWLELGRLPLGVLGFAFASIFYIRWNDRWFRQHADQEFKLHQLALDVDRASYATEMLLEWQEDKGGQMPPVMVDRLTAGLFTDHNTMSAVQHPSEDVVAALLKAASGVRVNLPGIGEVTLTGRQVRKLDKSLVRNRDN